MLVAPVIAKPIVPAEFTKFPRACQDSLDIFANILSQVLLQYTNDSPTLKEGCQSINDLDDSASRSQINYGRSDAC